MAGTAETGAGASAGTRPYLQGVRVLDVTGALAGPYCTMILSDLGAEVVKIEPVEGDALRGRTMGTGSRPLPFDLVHRDKGSLAVNLKAPEGREIILSLARRSHVLVENFRVGALAALRLGYEHLKDECPDLVYCSISGFGQFGPMRDAKGIDLIAQAYAGLMSVTGSDDGRLAKAGLPRVRPGQRNVGRDRCPGRSAAGPFGRRGLTRGYRTG